MSAAPASSLPRRGFLLRAAALTTVAVALPCSQAVALPAYTAGPGDYTFPKAVREGVARAEARNERLLAGSRSANGWDMETAADQGGSIATRPVPGTPVTGFQVRLGAAETVLVHLIRRFHYETAELQPDEVVGWTAPDRLRGPARNLASGTAVRIRPGHYPPGVRGGFSLLSSRSSVTSSPNSTAWSAGAAMTEPSTKPSSTLPPAPATPAWQLSPNVSASVRPHSAEAPASSWTYTRSTAARPPTPSPAASGTRLETVPYTAHAPVGARSDTRAEAVRSSGCPKERHFFPLKPGSQSH